MMTETELDLKSLFAKAHEAGTAKAKATQPTPMIVTQHENMLDDSSPVKKQWWVDQGVCGFAWVTIHPGTSKAARYAKEHYGASKGYPSGMQIWISDFGQSMELKEAYAQGFAAVLQEAGIKAYAGSRMD